MPSNSSIAAVRKDTQRLRARSTDAVRGFHRCGQKRHTTTWSECSALETKRIEFPLQYVPAPAKCRIHVAAAQDHVSLPLSLNQNLSRTPIWIMSHIVVWTTTLFESWLSSHETGRLLPLSPFQLLCGIFQLMYCTSVKYPPTSAYVKTMALLHKPLNEVRNSIQ